MFSAFFHSMQNVHNKNRLWWWDRLQRRLPKPQSIHQPSRHQRWQRMSLERIHRHVIHSIWVRKISRFRFDCLLCRPRIGFCIDWIPGKCVCLIVICRWHERSNRSTAELIRWTGSVDGDTNKFATESIGRGGKCADRRVWYGYRHGYRLTSSTPTRRWRCENSIVNQSRGKHQPPYHPTHFFCCSSSNRNRIVQLANWKFIWNC